MTTRGIMIYTNVLDHCLRRVAELDAERCGHRLTRVNWRVGENEEAKETRANARARVASYTEPVIAGMVPGMTENKFLLNWIAKPLRGCCVWLEMTKSYTLSPLRRTRWPLISMPLPCCAVQITGRLEA